MDDGIRVLGHGGMCLLYLKSHRVLSSTFRAGSGFKLNVLDLTSLTLNLGNHTTTPNVSVGVSLNYGDFVAVNISAGSNVIPLDSVTKRGPGRNTVVRIDSFGWQNNRVNLESITLNSVWIPSSVKLTSV